MPRLFCARRRNWIIFGLLCLCLIGGIFLALRNCGAQQSAGKLQCVAANVELDVSTFVRSIRPAYPYSVIPGGVYSSRELRDATLRDPIVASHYKGFDIARAGLVRATGPTLQYVSYRKNERVVWTTKPLRIPKGEVLLSDGINFARARCGNRLSSTPVGPAPTYGPDVELSMPDIDARRSTSTANLVAPVDILPVAELRLVESKMDSSHPSSENLNSPLRSAVQPIYAIPIVTTPIITGPGLGLLGTPPPPNPSFPVGPPVEPAVAPVPEPPTQWQVASTLAISFVLLFVFRRTSRKAK